jgi:DNA polymerase III subunit beta
MKFSVLQENLNEALANVSRFISSKSQLPVLNNILITTDNGRIKLSATNLDIGLNYWIGGKIEKEGSITIPSKEVTEFVSYLNTGKLEIELNTQNIFSIKSEKFDSDFTTISANDFPTLPPLNTKSSIDIQSSLLKNTVSQVVFSAATDDSRPVLTGVLCVFTKDSLKLVATDGFRLSLKTIKLVNPLSLPDNKESLTFLLPSRTLSEVVKLSKNDDTIKIGLTPDEHQVVFVLEDMELVSGLIDGEYPDYTKIIPESFNTNIFVNKEEFAQAIRIASVFASKSANVVKFNIKNNKLELSANASQLGKNKTELDAKVEGESLEIAFNYKFVSDFLSNCQGEEVLIKLNESLSPGLFQDQTNPDFTHIIMPVRIQD